MVAAKLSSKDKSLDENNIFAVDRHLSLLKSAAIYGANASGKSNLVKAIRFMQWFILNSSKETQATEMIHLERFKLSAETEGKPSSFEIVFLMDEKVHRYGFEITEKEVVSEWLFYTPTTKEMKIFERKGKNISVARIFKGSRGVIARTRENALFLSVAAQFNVEIADKVLAWFSENLKIDIDIDKIWGRQFTIKSLEHPKYRNKILQLLKGTSKNQSETKNENKKR
ncbi:AAA family ATPase, partial [Tumidithrix elongata RA019]|nr:AAA family ATPase [Tumidithrix elongata RA019]